METINVLMSCYNGEKYLDEQIASILNQKTSRKIVLLRKMVLARIWICLRTDVFKYFFIFKMRFTT